MPAPDLNAIVDVVDSLSGATSDDEAWLKADTFVRAKGANALNVAEVDRVSGLPWWFRSSMQVDWLQDYLAQDFVQLDGLLLAARAGQTVSRMTDGYISGFGSDGERARSLRDQLVSWDYRTLDSYAMTRPRSPSVICVTLSRPHDAPPPTRSDKILAAILGNSIRPPHTSRSPGATPFQFTDLSVRERDILSFLAAGLRNEMIAWKLGIAEVTVRVHVASARRKLRAATREQAIAIALRAGLLNL
ncbi:helix-turn-helix transcriptional regulator [Jannaschia marina]|uniref:helix-turn-helix transcriptional regulator n=1 Tax=Jannaschia marina TaxID=2741674 RepID=UPI0015C6D849|nr:helix-turn-helix transcriptional regulator [Jannaschia marina]